MVSSSLFRAGLFDRIFTHQGATIPECHRIGQRRRRLQINYYQHHIGDFIRDTSQLTDAQCMAYLRMIWMYYDTEQPLEQDADAIAFKIGSNAYDVKQILKHYFFEHEGFWHHSRCDKEILAFRDKSAKAKKSADARWKNANAMRTHSERNANERVLDANQEPITNNHKPIKENKRTPSRFDAQAHLVSLGVASELAADWLSVRKTKRLASTKTALETVEQEARKTGWPLDKVLRECCNRGWGGFKASWLTDNSQPKMTQHQLNQQGIARSLGLIPRDSSLSFFEGEARELAD